MKEFEQLANVQSRHAVQLWTEGKTVKAKKIDRDRKSLFGAIPGCPFPQKIHREEMKDTGLTTERLWMLGSAYKRKAWVSEAGRKNSLEKNAELP